MDGTGGVVSYDPKLVPAPCGLANHGNTCWANSVLQFLAGMPALTAVLIQYEHEFGKNRFARCYLAFIRAMLAGENVDTTQVIAALYDGLRNRGSGFDKPIGHQQCASEAFIHIIDVFDSKRITNIFGTSYNTKATCPHCGASPRIAHDENMSIKLTVDSPPLTSETDFTNYIRVQPDSPHGFRCDKCTQISDKWNWHKWLCRIGDICVVSFHFKPTSRGRRYYPETLRFRATGDRVLLYRLIGVVEHHGSEYLGQSSGHYTARSYRSGWFQLNDGSVSAAGPTPTADTFLVAYHMVSA